MFPCQKSASSVPWKCHKSFRWVGGGWFHSDFSVKLWSKPFPFKLKLWTRTKLNNKTKHEICTKIENSNILDNAGNSDMFNDKFVLLQVTKTIEAERVVKKEVSTS